MSEACYDPEAAVGLWSRMEQAEQGAPPQFLSTHPSSHNRMEKIRSWLNEAEMKREESGCGMTAGYGKYKAMNIEIGMLMLIDFNAAQEFSEKLNFRW